MADVSSFVGCKVSVELTSDTVITGTVFTYDEKNCALVVLQNPTSDRPNVKILNTCFIKSVSVLEKKPSDASDRLPVGVASGATLPSLTTNENLSRKINKSLSKAVDRRRYDTAEGATEALSIGACQLFDRLTLSNGQVAFSSSSEHLDRASVLAERQGVAVGKPDVVIIVGDILVSNNGGTGGASWMNPVVGEVRDGSDHHGMMPRVKQSIAAAFKATAPAS